MLSERPKSSLTDESPLLLGSVEDSDEVFPRYSQRDVRAKPCWGRLPVAWSFDGGPKTYGKGSNSQSGHGESLAIYHVGKTSLRERRLESLLSQALTRLGEPLS